VRVVLPAAVAGLAFAVSGYAAKIIGTRHNDVLRGTSHGDVIRSGAGNDKDLRARRQRRL